MASPSKITEPNLGVDDKQHDEDRLHSIKRKLSSYDDSSMSYSYNNSVDESNNPNANITDKTTNPNATAGASTTSIPISTVISLTTSAEETKEEEFKHERSINFRSSFIGARDQFSAEIIEYLASNYLFKVMQYHHLF